MTENTIDILDVDLNYKFFKSEKKIGTIVILHGWGAKSDSWINCAELLSGSGYDIYVPDLPGFGKTVINKVYSLDDYADLIEKFIIKLGLNNIILLGHSNGGAISTKIANRGVINIKKLILNNSSGIRNNIGRTAKRKFLGVVAKILKIFKFIPGYDKLRNLLYKAIGSHDYINSEDNSFLNKTYKNMISSDLREDFNIINIDTLIIWGEEDDYTPLSDGREIRINIKNSIFKMIEGEGHSIHLKSPLKLVRTIINNI